MSNARRCNICGLFGYSYNPEALPTTTERAIIAMQLIRGAQKRGRDACGYARWDEATKNVMWTKETGEYSDSSLVIETAEAITLLGHTRFATVGSRTKENAHPFHIGKIIGAHNGGIYNHKEMAEKYLKRKGFEVDSMHLLAHIDEKRDCSELEGYGAVTWFNLRDPGAIYLCAMHRGDLEVEVLSHDRGVVWASTTAIIADALRSARMYVDSKRHHLLRGAVYRVVNGTIEKTKQEIELKKWAVREYTNGYVKHSASTSTTLPTITCGATGSAGPGAGFGAGMRPTRRTVTVLHGNTPTVDEAYENAVRAYNREAGDIFSTTRRSERRRMNKLIGRTHNHPDYCPCTDCDELFKIASQNLQS